MTEIVLREPEIQKSVWCRKGAIYRGGALQMDSSAWFFDIVDGIVRFLAATV